MLLLFDLVLAFSAGVADPRHARFMSWLTSVGAQTDAISLGKSTCGDGYGAFVTRDVAEGELLFEVPSAACIGLYDACGDEAVGETLAKLVASGQGGATVALAGFLAKECALRSPTLRRMHAIPHARGLRRLVRLKCPSYALIVHARAYAAYAACAR